MNWRRILIAGLGVMAACSAEPAIEVPEGAFAPLPAQFQRGVNIEPIGAFGGVWRPRQLAASLDELVALGVDSVALIPSFFQAGLEDTEFTWRGGRERIDADTRAAIRAAHARGLDVLLKPHLWLQDRADGAWRGDIDPDQSRWPAWRLAYREAVLAYADLAASEGVAALSIGSELSALALSRADFWRQLAADVRQRFPGQIAYAANWDHEFEQIQWWPSVDVIGVDAFWPLVESPEAELDAGRCESRMGAIRSRLRQVAERQQRPLVLTEIGYRSAAGAAFDPWQWHDSDQAAAPELQALVYRCIATTFGTAADAGWLVGLYIWNWNTDPRWGGLRNSDFTPRGKPAQGVLQAWFRAPADARAGESPETGNQ